MKAASPDAFAAYEQDLDGPWVATKASPADSGEQLSAPGCGADGWMPAVVPGTVLGTLVHDGVYPDPYFGANNDSIPDISAQTAAFYTYWFRTTFELPAVVDGARIWLDLRGINYTARLYLNGNAVNVGHSVPPPINTVTGQPLLPNEIQGMFLRHAVDITAWAKPGGENTLAVWVQPPDPPGVPGGNGGGSPNIGNNVTMRSTVGWDWVIPIRDRNTGIWDRISVRTTGPVRIQHPHVVTTVLDADGNLQRDATVTLSAEVYNASSGSVTGNLTYLIGDTGQTGSLPVTLSAGETRTITFPAVTVPSPRLWWPNGYGRPELYSLDFAFAMNGGRSDSRQLRFGIREIRAAYVDVPAYGQKCRRFEVNGQPLFVRGADWIMTDAMLRRDYLSARRYRDEVRMFADMNLNLLRVWGGGIAERPELYDACDEHGLLVMQDFWISGEYNPPLSGYPKGYKELFLACARDTIRMLRNHPSLCFWSAGNENEPPAEILQALATYITGRTQGSSNEGQGDVPRSAAADEALDPTRILVPKSTSIANDTVGDYVDGPYGILDPSDFFTGNNLRDNPFNPEIGSVGTPVVETLRSMMKPEDASDFPTATEQADDVNPVWRLHDYIPYIDENGNNVMSPYGYPASLDRFCRLAQVLNYQQYQSLFEGYTSRMWQSYTGVLMWKGQNPWPGLRGAFYDWSLDPTGGLFGVRKACEPVHVQMNLDDATFSVVNTTAPALAGVAVTATFHDLAGRLLGTTRHVYSEVPAHGLSARVAIAAPQDLPPVYLLSLELRDSHGALLSRNLYWQSSVAPPDFTALNDLAQVTMAGSVDAAQEGSRYVLRAALRNPTQDTVVFSLQLQLRKRGAPPGLDPRVLPAYYEDSYFTLLPGEVRLVTADCAVDDAGGQTPELWVAGWNVKPQPIAAAQRAR